MQNGLVALNVNNEEIQDSNTEEINTFVYNGSGAFEIGDIVAVYSGTVPSERTEATDNGEIVYAEIVGRSGSTYKYVKPNSTDVLFVPDILPLSMDYLDASDNETVVPAEDLTFDSSVADYVEMGLSSETTVDAGDFIMFFISNGEEITDITYAVIDEVVLNYDEFIIRYTIVTADDVLASMDLYKTRNQEIKLDEETENNLSQSIKKQAEDSGFIDEAIDYLSGLAIETEGFQSLTSASQLEYVKNAGEKRFKVTKTSAKAKIKSGDLTHFEKKKGVRAELVLSFEAEVDLGNDNKIVISMEAVFAQEFMLNLNVCGGAVWSRTRVFKIPYISDYTLNANFDVGTFTGIGITATAQTKGPDDDDDDKKDDEFSWDSIFGEDVVNAGKQIIEIGKQIQELVDLADQFLGSPTFDEEEGEESDSSSGLAEKYAEMIKNSDDSWIEIVRKEIFKAEGYADPFGVVAYGLTCDLVVSANLYVTIGMTMEYESAKRYNFSLKLFKKSATHNTIDLVEPNFEFVFYCMGTVGVKAGLEFEVAIGLFSINLDSIGVTAEAGVYAQLWGYFYYEMTINEKDGLKSTCSGAMYIEVGVYLKITFKAQLLNNDKLTYQPTLYDNTWVLWSAGQNNNVFDFVCEKDDDGLNYEVTAVDKIRLPEDLYLMKYMNMKTGVIYGEKDEDGKFKKDDDGKTLYAKSYNSTKVESGSDDEERFYVTVSNPKFTYNPANDTIYINAGGSIYEECTVTFTWRGAPIAFTSNPIERTVKIYWSNPENERYIVFETNGGSSVGMITGGAGDEITWPANPTKLGYNFDGWYTSSALTTLYTGSKTSVPAVSVELFAKWTPKTDTGYTVNYYLQNLENEKYTLYLAEKLYDGTTDSTMVITPRNITGYYCISDSVSGLVVADGTTVIKVFYNRNVYQFVFANGEDGDNAQEKQISFKYGAQVKPPLLVREGFNFSKWVETDDTTVTVDFYDQAAPVTAGSVSVLDYTAQWTRCYYNLQLEYNDGSDVREIPVYYKQSMSDGKPATDPVREGYRFGGWYVSRNYQTLFDFDGLMKPATTTAYARWIELADYTEEYYLESADSADYVLIEAETVTYDDVDVATLITAVEKTFAGFTLDKGISGTVASARLLSGGSTLKLYYKRNVYPLAFDSCGGSTVATVNYKYGAAIVVPTAPTLVGYVFEGWYSDAEYTTEFDFTATMPIGGLNAFAKWSVSNNVAYKVEYYLQNIGATEFIYTSSDSYVGTNLTTVTAAEKDFDGFTFDEGNASNYLSAAIISDGSLVLKRYYTRNIYTLSFNSNNGSAVSDFEQYYGGTLSRPVNPTRAGYSFVDWYLEATLETVADFTVKMPENGLTVYAKWTVRNDTPYTVQHYFEDVEGETYTLDISTDRLTGTSETTATAVPRTVDGYTFDEDNENAVLSLAIAGDGSTALKVYYTRNLVTMSFNTYGGTEIDSITQKYGSAVVAPDDPTKAGYDFDGWTSYDIAYSFTTMPASDVTINATWSIKINISYSLTHYGENTDGSGYDILSESTSSGTFNTSISINELSFDGFEFDAENENNVLTSTIAADGSSALKRYYTRKSYTLSFDVDGGSEIAAVSVKYGFTMQAPTAPTKAGFDFDNWYVQSNSNVLFDFTAAMPMENTTAYAKWTNRTDTAYTVAYYTEKADGTFEVKESEVKTGATGATVTIPEKAYDYFTFAYGNPDNVLSASILADGSLTLKRYYTITTYTVKFMLLEDRLSAFSVKYQATITRPDDFIELGYDFVDWYADAECTELYVFGSAMPASEVVIYSKWTPKDDTAYSIENYLQNAIGDGFTKTGEVESGTGTTLATATATETAVEGFTFDATNTNNVLSGTILANGSLVLKRYYTRNTYTLTFDSNGGSAVASQTVRHGAEISEPEKPEYDGYNFRGWYQDEELENAFNFFMLMPIGGLTVYAKWEAKSNIAYTIERYYETVDGSDYTKTTASFTGTAFESITVAETATDGFTFDSNNENNVLTGTVAADGSLVLKAYYTRNSYTISFDTDGGNEIESITQKYGSVITQPDNPIKAGYEFYRWLTAENATFSFTTMPFADVALTAVWSNSTGVNYVVRYYGEKLLSLEDPTGGEGAAGGSGETGGEATVPEEKEMYIVLQEDTLSGETNATVYASILTFEGFTYNTYLDTNVTSGVVLADGSLVLSLYYSRNSYTTIFDANNSEEYHVTQMMPFGSEFMTLVEVPQKVGYTFENWYYDEALTQLFAFTDTVPAHDLTVYGNWTPNMDTLYRVEYYLEEPSDVTIFKIDAERSSIPMFGETDSTVVMEAMERPSIYGFEFDADNENNILSATILPDGSTVLKLYYKRVVVTIFFEVTVGDPVDSISARYGTDVVLPTLNNPGYKFCGWFTDQEYTTQVGAETGSITVTAENQTFYAKQEVQ